MLAIMVLKIFCIKISETGPCYFDSYLMASILKQEQTDFRR